MRLTMMLITNVWLTLITLVFIPLFIFSSRFIIGKSRKFGIRQALGLVTAAAVKFCVLYVLVVKVVCGMASGALLGKKLGDIVVLAPPMLKMLPTMFAWPQLVTALAGGAIALAMLPVLRKALHK